MDVTAKPKGSPGGMAPSTSQHSSLSPAYKFEHPPLGATDQLLPGDFPVLAGYEGNGLLGTGSGNDTVLDGDVLLYDQHGTPLRCSLGRRVGF